MCTSWSRGGEYPAGRPLRAQVRKSLDPVWDVLATFDVASRSQESPTEEPQRTRTQ